MLDIMEAAWPEEDARLKKFSVNALVGLWSTQEQYLYSVRTSQRAEDCLGHHMKRLVSYAKASTPPTTFLRHAWWGTAAGAPSGTV